MTHADRAVNPVEAEYAALAAQVTEQRGRADRLRALADQLEENAARDEHLVAQLAALLGRDPQLRLEDFDRRLRGQRLREVALEIFRREVGPGAPIHYKQWYGLLLAAGHKVGGRDPVATFLAQVHRCDAVERVGQRTGRFRLVAYRPGRENYEAEKSVRKHARRLAALLTRRGGFARACRGRRRTARNLRCLWCRAVRRACGGETADRRSIRLERARRREGHRLAL